MDILTLGSLVLGLGSALKHCPDGFVALKIENDGLPPTSIASHAQSRASERLSVIGRLTPLQQASFRPQHPLLLTSIYPQIVP